MSRARAGRLSIVFPRALAATYAVDDDPFILGRRGAGPIRHPTVSRAHLEIAWSAEAGGHVARDLGSHNGSALDGRPLGHSPRPLACGSVLRLGDVLAVWEAPAAPSDADCLDVSGEIPGRAASIQALRAAIRRAAADHAPAFIIGETGAGKERVARELHRLSGRTGPLISINCAALAPSLIESQLFGHSRGAFTGALEAQRGLFRDAHNGSLLLDEIGELPASLQAKLLRVIQEREVHPLGGADPVSVDVRVIAATHRRPAEAIAAGILREDLYARLSLWELHVPALRNRRVDLYDWLVRMHGVWQRSGAPPSAFPQLSVDAVEALLLQRWPLNLRALERLVRELTTRCQGRLVEPCDLPTWLDAAPTPCTQTSPPSASGSAPWLPAAPSPALPADPSRSSPADPRQASPADAWHALPSDPLRALPVDPLRVLPADPLHGVSAARAGRRLPAEPSLAPSFGEPPDLATGSTIRPASAPAASPPGSSSGSSSGSPSGSPSDIAHAPTMRPSMGHPRPPLPSRDEFVAAFAQLGGSVRALARHFGRERRQIYRWIEAHGVRD